MPQSSINTSKNRFRELVIYQHAKISVF